MSYFDQRDFPPVRTRSGDHVRNLFELRCSDPDQRGCENKSGWSTWANMPDPKVRKVFQNMGWVTGRNRKHDVCPECLELHRAAGRMKVVKDGRVLPSVEEIQKREDEAARSAQTIMDFDRKDPVSEDLEAQVPEPLQEEDPVQTVLREVRDMRAAIDLVLEVVSKLTDTRPVPPVIPVTRNRVFERTPKSRRRNDFQPYVMSQIAQGFHHYREMLDNLSRVHPDWNPKSLSPTLSNMIKNGILVRKGHGVYDVAVPAEVDGIVNVNRYGKVTLTSLSIPKRTWVEAGFTPDTRLSFERVGDGIVVREGSGSRASRIGVERVALQTGKIVPDGLPRHVSTKAAPGVITIFPS
jgi:hypothetical protein